MNSKPPSLRQRLGPQATRRCRVGTALLLAGSIGLAVAQSTIDANNRFAYGANVGWTDWRVDGVHGVRVGEYICSGYCYAANVGWICLGTGTPADGIRYQQSTSRDFGVNCDGLGNLSGCAWAANLGWLIFTNRDASGSAFPGPRIDLVTGRLSGFVWSANAGWICLSNAVAAVRADTIAPGEDTDRDGIADAWELLHFGSLTMADAASDSDQDGFTDLQECLADTDPADPTSALRITAPAVGGANTVSSLTWTSQPTRQYRILSAAALAPGAKWTDAGLGLIPPDAGATTTRQFVDPPARERYYRIEAVRPLSP